MKKSIFLKTIIIFGMAVMGASSYAIVSAQRPANIDAQRSGNAFDRVCDFMKKQEKAVEKHISDNYSSDATQYQVNDALFDGSLLSQIIAGPLSSYVIQKQANGAPQISYVFGNGSFYFYLDGVSVTSSALINASNEIVGWHCVTNLQSSAYGFSSCDCIYTTSF